MIIKLKIAVNPKANSGKKTAVVKAWKVRGTNLAIHKSFGTLGYTISQTQVGLYIPPISISLKRCLKRYRRLIAENWDIRKPVFGKKSSGKKYNYLLSICKNNL